MTYDEEIKKLKMDHRLQVRRAFYDKILLGAIVLIAGFVANYLIEKYKLGEVERHYRLAKQYEAAFEVCSKAGNLGSHYSKYCANLIEETIFRENHQKLLDDFVSTYNSKDFLFSAKLKDPSQCVVHLHMALLKIDAESRKSYYELAIKMMNLYGRTISVELGIEEQAKDKVLQLPDLQITDEPRAFLMRLQQALREEKL